MANTLTRWDPFTEMGNMRSLMDRFFNDSVLRFPGFLREELGAPTLGLDVYETANDYVVKAQVPGVDPKDVDINIEDDVLTIKGEFRHEDEVSEDQYLRRELRYGHFERSLRLPPSIDAEKAQAKFEHGELKLTLPKRPEARSRSIKITPEGVIPGPSNGQSQQ